MRFANVTELIWSDELEALLRMCGEEERLIGVAASDYDRFFALCRSAHLLRGNLLIHRISSFLASILNRPVSLSEKTAEEIWKDSAEYFLFANVSRSLWEDFNAESTAEKELDICPRLSISNFFDGDLFLSTSQKSWEAWRDEMRDICDKSLGNACSGVMLLLPKAFVFSSPHPYQIGRILQSPKREEEDQNLMIAQLFRFLSEDCSERKLSLLCRVECDPREAVKLFAYAEEQVGLLRLIWSLAVSQSLDALIAFSGKPHQNSVEAALPSSEVSASRLHAFSEGYPLGKLMILE